MQPVEHPTWKPLFLGTAVGISALLVQLFKIPLGFLFVVTCFVLVQLFMHALFLKSAERIIGPVAASLISVLALHWIGLHTLPGLLCCAVIVFGFSYYYAQKFYDYGMILGAITSALVMTFYYFVSPHEAYQIALYWPLNIIFGAILTCLLALLLQLAHPFRFYEPQHTTKLPIQLPKPNLYATLVALRMSIAIFLVILENFWLKDPSTTVQGVIAAAVVSAQLRMTHAHHRLFFRVLGVIVGACIAIFYGKLFSLYYSIPFLIAVITLTLMLFSWLTQVLPRYLEYFFLQAGVMIPVILFDTSGHQFFNESLGIHRALGSIEGGLIALVVVYLFHFLMMDVMGKQNLPNR